MVPIFDAEGMTVAEGLAFYTPQSPPGTSYEQYHECVHNMQVPHHFNIDEGEVEVVGGTGQAEDTELMTRVLEDLSALRPSKYVSGLMNALFSNCK